MTDFVLAAHPVNIKHRRIIFGNAVLSLAIVEKEARIGFVTAFREVNVGFSFAVDDFHCLSRLIINTTILSENVLAEINVKKHVLDVLGLTPSVGAVEAKQVCSRHFNAAMVQHPFLVSDVRKILGEFVTVGVCGRQGGAFHLVDGPAPTLLVQNIDGTIVAFEVEGGLADVLHPLSHTFFGFLDHGGDVKFPFGVGGHFLEIAEVLHGEVAHLIALVEPCFQRGVVCGLRWLVNPQP